MEVLDRLGGRAVVPSGAGGAGWNRSGTAPARLPRNPGAGPASVGDNRQESNPPLHLAVGPLLDHVEGLDGTLGFVVIQFDLELERYGMFGMDPHRAPLCRTTVAAVDQVVLHGVGPRVKGQVLERAVVQERQVSRGEPRSRGLMQDLQGDVLVPLVLRRGGVEAEA